MALPGASKLDEQKVENIKKLFILGYGDQHIADMFFVSRGHINKIRLGKRWNAEKRSYLSKVEMERIRPKQKWVSNDVSKPNLYDVICNGIVRIIKSIKG